MDLDKRKNKERASIWFFPVFDNLENLSEQYYRCLWYLPNISAYEIMLPVTAELASHLSLRKRLPRPEYMGEFQGDDNHISFPCLDTLEQYQDALTAATSVALWKALNSTSPQQAVGKLENVHILDKNYPSFFEEPWGSAVFIREFVDSNVLESYRLESKNTLREYATTLKPIPRVYIFATGPSLKQAFDFDFSDGVRIICNTIVGNKRLLEHINPNFVVAGDAAFHYGCSKFAERFRKDLLQAINQFDALLVLPEIFAPLMLTHYPQLKDHLVALPDVPADSFNFSILEDFHTRRVHNIMNQIMLPLASSLADEILVIGADGRRPDNSESLWRHDTSSYYEGLSQTVEACHPSYFRYMSWDWYYNHHCDLVSQVIENGESLGKRYISLTPSFIPALHKREVNTKSE